MVSGVFGMFFIHRKRTASLPLSETAPFVRCLLIAYFAGSGRQAGDLCLILLSCGPFGSAVIYFRITQIG